MDRVSTVSRRSGYARLVFGGASVVHAAWMTRPREVIVSSLVIF